MQTFNGTHNYIDFALLLEDHGDCTYFTVYYEFKTDPRNDLFQLS